jgi:hypothetical protein
MKKKTIRNKMTKRRNNKNRTVNNRKQSKKWITAVDAAQKTLSRTGSLRKARMALRIQAYQNARKLFGSVGERM